MSDTPENQPQSDEELAAAWGAEAEVEAEAGEAPAAQPARVLN